ncbi:MAG TPA: diacylglycerol kinase family protein [Parapedobacter sp.]|nr:diacylglycerol kinase family protein [Parapedobacter sp.]
MKATPHVHLLHNPKAGDQDHIKEELISRIESQGFTCKYASIKEKGWKRFKSGTALVVIAGGDGTIREVFKKLVNRRILDKPLVIALMPSGTANNFAKTLEIQPHLDEFERCIKTWKPKQIDIGLVNNLRNARFFIEGLGCGIVPELIKKMRDIDLSAVHTAERELEMALKTLLEIVKTYPAKSAKVMVDGKRYDDEYLSVEVLNIRSIGPNLVLAPHADPTDGKFEVALLRPCDREAFLAYVGRLGQQKSNGHLPVPWQIVTATREIIIDCDHRAMHVDDELVTLKKRKRIEIAIRPGILDILT